MAEVPIVDKGDEYVLNHVTRVISRSPDADVRHDFGQHDPGDPRARYCEGWRLPIVDTHGGVDVDPGFRYAHNDVTFVWYDDAGRAPSSVGVLGTFAALHRAVPLSPVALPGGDGDGPSPFWAATVVLPKGEVHRYRFVVDGSVELDPVNPQTVTADDGGEWSRFFTQECGVPVTFEGWELVLLDRLTDHILPFRTEDGAEFLSRFYNGIDALARAAEFRHAYRLDESVGVVNYIDKLLAREERHHLVDYRICLRLVDRVLRARNPAIEPGTVARDEYVRLYGEMASGSVPGWDYGAYGNPRYFLQLLRRHTLTGAFAHPKYGGNALAAGWAYLQERYRDDAGATLFNWRRAIEAPLGDSTDYRG